MGYCKLKVPFVPSALPLCLNNGIIAHMSAILRIIQVVNVRWFNATAWYALFLSLLLKRAGHEVLVLALPSTDPERIGREWGLDVKTLPLNASSPRAVFALGKELAQIVQDFKPDIVNCPRGENFILWGFLRKWIGGFAIVRTRGDQRPPRKNLPNIVLHRCVADALIATNSRTAEEFVSKLGCPESQVTTIFGGVDTEVFCFNAEKKRKFRLEYGISPEDLVLGFVGRFDEVKGVQELIFAVGEILRREGAALDHLKLLLVGFASQLSLDQVKAWVKEQGIEDRVIITGKHPDVVACISAMDVGVIASQGSETVARAAFEIMSCGVPLVSTTVGVMPDLLPEYALSEVGNSESFIKLLSKVLLDKNWRDDLREECLVRISSLSEQDFLAQSLAVYERVSEKYKSEKYKSEKYKSDKAKN